jgi:hypothetical protein
MCCSDEPWVNASGTTQPCDRRCTRPLHLLQARQDAEQVLHVVATS